MASIGLFCPPSAGHLNPMAALGRTLQSRGHRVVLFGIADVEEFVRSCGFEFRVLGPDEYPAGSLENSVTALGKLKGTDALKLTINAGRQLADLSCRFAPTQVSDCGIELMVVDQNEPAAGSVAEHLQIPFVNLLNLPLNFDPNVPPPFSGWAYHPSGWSRLRNRLAYGVFYWMLGPITRVVNRYRMGWGLRMLRTPEDSFSRIGQICQMTAEFDFPRTLPANFFYTGLLFDESRLQIDPPLQNPNGEPLVYASLGTILNQDPAIYRHIADACSTLDVQLVISLGGGQVDQLGDLSRNTIVVKYVPQHEMLKKAVLAVTHAGLNTVQEALHLGVPMVAIPITNDQPAVAARLRHCGAGVVVPVSKLTGTKLREAITKVIQDDTYRKAAQKQRDAILKAGGVQRAAEIVEMILNLNRTARLAAHI